MFDLEEALTYVVRKDGSDLHLKVPSRPLARINGQLAPLEYYDPMRPEDTERVLREAFPDVKLVRRDRTMILTGSPDDLQNVARAMR